MKELKGFYVGQLVHLRSLKYPVKISTVGKYSALGTSTHPSGKQNNIEFIENLPSGKIVVLSGNTRLEYLNPDLTTFAVSRRTY